MERLLKSGISIGKLILDDGLVRNISDTLFNDLLKDGLYAKVGVSGEMFNNVGKKIATRDRATFYHRAIALGFDAFDAEDLNFIGTLYFNGEGVEKNDEEAIRYYKLSADQGNANAQCYLGFCYGNGEGIDRNDEEAFKYFKLSANQGYARAQYCLGACYESGRGVDRNDEEALKYYRMSAAQGDEDAINAVKEYEEKMKDTTGTSC